MVPLHPFADPVVAARLDAEAIRAMRVSRSVFRDPRPGACGPLSIPDGPMPAPRS